MMLLRGRPLVRAFLKRGISLIKSRTTVFSSKTPPNVSKQWKFDESWWAKERLDLTRDKAVSHIPDSVGAGWSLVSDPGFAVFSLEY